MNDRETRRYDMFGPVQTFGADNTAAVGRLIKAGMKEVNYLDAIMRNKYTRNPDKLRASHIERAPQREQKPGTGGPVTAITKP